MTRFLDKVPHYADAPSISTLDAAELTPESFYADYIDRLRPCLVRNAVRHWPAFERWRSVEYLREKVGDVEVKVATRPLIEPVFGPQNDGAYIDLPFVDALDHLASSVRGHYVLHAYPVEEGSRIGALAGDVGGFPFLTNTAEPRLYRRKRAFLFKDSYTDWHCHNTDETLMCQVKGAKEALLLPPDSDTWRLLTSIWKGVGPLWDVDTSRFPAWKELRPYRVVVGEGDALYIPTYWWHAIESIGDQFGWTVAWCWRTPLHLVDPRLAGVRAELKSLEWTRYAPLMLFAPALSLVRRRGRPPYAV